MVGCGFVVFMQLLEIINEVVNSLCIKELYLQSVPGKTISLNFSS